MQDQILKLFDDPAVTDVAASPRGVLVKAFGKWAPTGDPNVFKFAQDDLQSYLLDLAEACGVRLDYVNPLNTLIFGGFRVHASIGAGVSPEPVATFRRLGSAESEFECRDRQSIERFNFIQQSMASHQNVLVAGPAGAGKTTLLRTLLNRFDTERVITVEDAPELRLPSPNAVSLIAREANSEGFGEVGMTRLVSESLRMSPDRIAVGEIRGAELLVLVDALNTGHSGAGATIHANSLSSVAARLQSIGAKFSLSERALTLLVLNAIHVVAFVDREHRISGVGRLEHHGEGLEVKIVC